VQRGTQERRYEGEDKQKDNENGKSIILERSGFKKKRTRILGLCETTCDCGSGGSRNGTGEK
jgi:hypothetical protein